MEWRYDQTNGLNTYLVGINQWVTHDIGVNLQLRGTISFWIVPLLPSVEALDMIFILTLERRDTMSKTC